MNQVTQLICQHCRAALSVQPGTQIVTCSYCGTQNMIRGGSPAPGAPQPAGPPGVPAGAMPGFPSQEAEMVELARLRGEWEGAGFDVVNLHGSFGTYSDSYGSLPCRINLRAIGPGQFTASWSERDRRRYGTMSLSLSADGAALQGRWSAAPDCELRPGSPTDAPLTFNLVRRAGSELAELAGEWYGAGYACVNLHGSFGSYTDTYSRQPGRLDLRAVGPYQYEGTWGERDGKRHGSMRLTLAPDGATAEGELSAAPDCEIRPGSPASEKVVLTRLRWALNAALG